MGRARRGWVGQGVDASPPVCAGTGTSAAPGWAERVFPNSRGAAARGGWPLRGTSTSFELALPRVERVRARPAPPRVAVWWSRGGRGPGSSTPSVAGVAPLPLARGGRKRQRPRVGLGRGVRAGPPGRGGSPGRLRLPRGPAGGTSTAGYICEAERPGWNQMEQQLQQLQQLLVGWQQQGMGIAA